MLSSLHSFLVKGQSVWVSIVDLLWQTQCQLELDQVLERISKMPFRDNRGPLEDLYALHIPNCDKRGQYNLKQVTPTFIYIHLMLKEQCIYIYNTQTHTQIHTPQRSHISRSFAYSPPHTWPSSVRCRCMARGGSAGALTPRLAGPSQQPPLWGETQTAASTQPDPRWTPPSYPRNSTAQIPPKHQSWMTNSCTNRKQYLKPLSKLCVMFVCVCMCLHNYYF